MQDDWRDLQLFDETRDEAALARVIARHADFVYSACLRQLRNPALAEDAAQAVFILLAKKAGSIHETKPLVSWLFTVARYASKNVLRGERRRRKYETEAAMSAGAVVVESSQEMDELIDGALARLNEKDHRAILLRFFEDNSHEQVAHAMGISADAAKMRVRRAIERLREQLVGRGITTTSAGVEAGLLAWAVKPAPPGFVSSAVNAAVASPSNVASAALAQRASFSMSLQKLWSLAATVSIVIATAAGLAWAMQLRSAPPSNSATAASQPATAPSTAPAWRAEFNSVYRLEPGEAVRHVPPPFIAGRAQFLKGDLDPSANFINNGNKGDPNPAANPAALAAVFVQWDDRSGQVEHARRLNDHPWNLESLVLNLVELKTPEFMILPQVSTKGIPGDWIIRRGSTPEQRLLSLQKALAQTPAAFTAEKKHMKRDVIIARGTFAPDEWPKSGLNIVLTEDDNRRRATGDVNYYFRTLWHSTGRPIINEWKGAQHVAFEFTTLPWQVKNYPPEQFQDLLKRLGDQLHIDLTPESREFDVWILSPAKPSR